MVLEAFRLLRCKTGSNPSQLTIVGFPVSSFSGICTKTGERILHRRLKWREQWSDLQMFDLVIPNSNPTSYIAWLQNITVFWRVFVKVLLWKRHLHCRKQIWTIFCLLLKYRLGVTKQLAASHVSSKRNLLFSHRNSVYQKLSNSDSFCTNLYCFWMFLRIWSSTVINNKIISYLANS